MRRERFGAAGRWKTVCARGANRAAPAGRSALPLGVSMDVIARLLVCLFLISVPTLASPADEPRFTGNTIADATLKRDALRMIGMIVHGKFKCDALDLIEAEGIPADAQPHVWLPPGAGPATYERWIVTACSHKQPFLVVFWPAKEGGMMFQVKAEKVADS